MTFRRGFIQIDRDFIHQSNSLIFFFSNELKKQKVYSENKANVPIYCKFNSFFLAKFHSYSSKDNRQCED